MDTSNNTADTETPPTTNDLQQERMDESRRNEVANEPLEDQQQEAEEKTFKYRLNTQIYSVTCDTSITVLDALNATDVFKKEKEKHRNKEHLVLLRRSKDMRTAAVKTDFPCCLIDNDEIIDVTFIRNNESASTKQNTTEQKQHKPDMFVNFYVNKEGGEKVKYILKSKALRTRVEYVCVYAHKEETLKTALMRDGRFTDKMFQKHCALSELGTESRHEMSQPVKPLDQKIFKVIVLNDTKQPDSQDDLARVKTKSNVTSDTDVANTSQKPVNTEQENKPNEHPAKPTPKDTSTSNSKEILEMFRDQFTGFLENLMNRENLGNKAQVQNFFREEYAKSVQSFLEVKKVKMLAKLSDAVCQILVEGRPEGTGFLLFDRYVLTNAHVIEPFASCIQVDPYPLIQLQKTVTTVFNFEDYQSKQLIELPVKAELYAFAYGEDSKGRRLDYALLELETDPPADIPKLLDRRSFTPPRAGSQICIVGHPGEGVKKVDPCFIIGLVNAQRPMDNALHVITQQYFEKNKITYDSCFSHGSSGSPVFDEHCYLIGIHTGHFPYKDESTTEQRNIEYAFSLQPILEDIDLQMESKKRCC
ncbi:putative protein FAM111A-like [Triplophysa rosa]|uniref:Protein FAM111A n=2 Tax=Triplophysa rosa TaxID=992332 RepID=A0A9W8CA54_TRIRA|nr:putative protein FAM111A-like [Triplophysa rosa]